MLRLFSAVLMGLVAVMLWGCGEQGATQAFEGVEAVALADTTPVLAPSDDWPWWRGPNHNGIAASGQQPVTSWSETENVIWKTPIPGRGHASPVVTGSMVVLATADEKAQTQVVVAFDRKSGEQLWSTQVSQGGFPASIHRKNTHATSTVAADGERLIVSFCHHDRIFVTALDYSGKQLWERNVGAFAPRQYKYGYAPSPAFYQGVVLIAADYDGGGHLTALERETGKVVWQTPRPARLSYSSPVVAHLAGRDQLLISGCDMVAGYDPSTGKQLWKADVTTMATCGTMVWDGDLVFASGGYPKSETACVKADGSGKVVWTNRQKCYEQSMLAVDGFLYAVTDQGIAYCWRGSDGQEMWRERLGGSVSASPILAAGNIYLTNESGTTFVYKADPKQFTQVAVNQLGDEGFSTPAICGGRIYLRASDSTARGRQETLYCIGKK